MMRGSLLKDDEVESILKQNEFYANLKIDNILNLNKKNFGNSTIRVFADLTNNDIELYYYNLLSDNTIKRPEVLDTPFFLWIYFEVNLDYFSELIKMIEYRFNKKYKSFENFVGKPNNYINFINYILSKYQFIIRVKNKIKNNPLENLLVLDDIDMEDGINTDINIAYNGNNINEKNKIKFTNVIKNDKELEKELFEIIDELVDTNILKDELVDTNILKKEIEERIPILINTYRVGQAGFNTIDESIVFDIGYTRFLSNEPANHQYIINKSINVMKNINPDIFIISHTDLDHIIGTNNLNKNMFNNKIWVFPKQIHDSFFALILIAHIYAVNKNNLFFIDINTEVKGNNIAIFSGDGKSRKGSNKKNNSGLLLWLKNGDHEALLTGDCVYDSIQNYSNNYLKNYNYLVVPHHCPNVSNRNINYFTKGIKNNKYAIIPVGYDPTFKHPDVNHMQKLSANYQVIRTDDLTKINQHQEYISYDLVNNKIHF